VAELSTQNYSWRCIIIQYNNIEVPEHHTTSLNAASQQDSLCSLHAGLHGSHALLYLQVSPDGVIVPQLWQLLNTGYKIQPPHPMTARILLPYPSWLQTLGMQLTVLSIRDRSQISTGSDTSHKGRSWDSVSSTTDKKGRDDINSRDRGILHQGNITDSNHAQTASRETDPGRKGGPRSSQKAADKHQCWQPVLLAYGQSARETMQSASAREVIRTNSAELSLWAIEAAGKEIGVLSDPSCVLHLM